MGTRSLIGITGIEEDDGTRSLIGITGIEEDDVKSDEVIYIYCHWDGYPSHNGKILLEHYADEAKILNLMDLGDLSSLGPEIGERHDFQSPNKNWCTSYSRDRGELEAKAQVSSSEEDFKNLDHGSEYKYLFKNNKWYFTSGRHGFVELTQEACKD